MSCPTLNPTPPRPTASHPLVQRLARITCFDAEDVAEVIAELPITYEPSDLVDLAWDVIDAIEGWSWTIAGGVATDA